ncbi:MAG: DUF1697 domain-containing protein [Actinobacteria bacterium]|nr:DUF1697 domain-containing protein [Actinomycetota bacterium]
MAESWVALLRGVNLGSRNRVPMAELRVILEEAGYGDVATYIQSGNVLFTRRASDRAALARKLEHTIEDAFGVSAAVVLRTAAEIRKVARSHPFGTDTSKTHVAFLAKKPPAASVRSLKSEDPAQDQVQVTGSDVFLHYPDGVQGARLTGALLERQLGMPATIRNWRTVTRLAELSDSS